MHLNVKTIFKMTINGYKSCRKLRKQVLNTELKIRYTKTKYKGPHGRMVSVFSF